jgi:nicotinamide-nucleotide amidase
MDVAHRLAARVGNHLKERRLLLATAESCTGGWVAQVVTAIPGSSAWFERGFVTYSDASKEEMLGVRGDTLALHGAVSEEVVREMAEGALRHSHAKVSVAITGVAGPDGGSPRKPVGTVWLAWAVAGRETRCRAAHYAGDREMIRQQAVMAALQGIIDAVD